MRVSKKTAMDFIKGDESAISQVYTEYRSLLYFIISSYVKTKEDCEDVYQNVFLNILNKKQDIQDPANLHSYLCLTAKNLAINYAKQASKYVYLENEDEFESLDTQRLNELLPYNLTRNEKVVVGYKLCFSLTYKEISEITKVPVPTLKLRYSQALKKIKEVYR